MDRDIVASMNITCKGWSRFCHPRGLPIEAVKWNMDFDKNPLILSRWKQVGKSPNEDDRTLDPRNITKKSEDIR
jgi:hypothetical protein